MSITKKALIIGIGSTLAVGGITTTIAVPLSQTQAETEQPPASIPSTPLTNAKTVNDALAKLTVNSIQFQANETNTKFKRNEHYAFNINASDLALKQEDKNTFPSWVSFSFKIDSTKNKVVDLNEGKLIVELEVKKDDAVIGSRTFNINDFKTVSKQAKRLVKIENQKVLLDLSNVTTESYRTIENLNELKTATGLRRLRTDLPTAQTVPAAPAQSGLTTLLHGLMVDGDQEQKPDPKLWDVETKVKLDRIVKGTDRANFHLITAENNKYLKLVSKTEDKKEEILVDEVIVTNLLASNINIRPIGLDAETNKRFEEEFAKNASESGYKKVGETNDVQLEVKQSSNDTLVSTLNVNPYIIEKETKDQEIKANLLVSFGSNEQIKTYDFSVEKDLNELKEAEFSFNVYVKKFDSDNGKVLKAMTLTTGSELDSYFAPKNFSMPIMTSTLETGSRATMPKGGFTKIELKSSVLKKDFVLGEAMKVNEEEQEGLDVHQQTLLSENWATFAAYSYKGITSDNVLLTPSISIVHLDVKTPVVAEEIRPGSN